MAIDHRHVGETSELRTVVVEEGFLRLFAKAVGESRPIYTEIAVARAAGLRGLLAPPTYLFSLHLSAPAAQGDVFDPHGMAVDPSRTLHGEQSFEAFEPIYSGDTLMLRTVTTDIVSKKGGALEMITQHTEAFNADGALCGRMATTMVVRNG